MMRGMKGAEEECNESMCRYMGTLSDLPSHHEPMQKVAETPDPRPSPVRVEKACACGQQLKRDDHSQQGQYRETPHRNQDFSLL